MKKVSASNKNRPLKSGTGIHTEKEDHPWEINIPDHPQRTDSPEYILSRKVMNEIVPKSEWFYGAGSYQDHHGGGLWVKDENGWFMLKNLAGIEWSSQFSADPEKVDRLRQNAKRLYAKFPLTAPAFKEMGIDLESLLNSPITDSAGIAKWTDSICNASVPLPPVEHTGILPKGGGVHHYPTPITDIEYFKHDDFQLWVTDGEGKPAAVVPVAERKSSDKRAEVVYATPGTKLHERLHKAHNQGNRLIVGEKHPLAKQAFASKGKI